MSAPSLLLGDTPTAVEFLCHFAPEGPWVLTAIRPDGGKVGNVVSATYRVGQERELAAWIDGKQGRANIYFLVNVPREAIDGHRHAEKADIVAVRALHVDVDPERNKDIKSEQERIKNLFLGSDASIILFSGGGYQAFWLLRDPVPVNDVAVPEAYNRGLEKKFGGDHCHNINRIMRLPGTINLPDQNKRDKGRMRVLATIVRADWEALHDLSKFTPVTAPPEVVRLDDKRASFPREELPAACQRLVKHGYDPTGEHDYKGDRSRAVYAVCCMMVRAGRTNDEIVEMLLDLDNGISAHVRDQANPRRTAQRQAERARVAVSDDFIRNDKKQISANNQFNIRMALARMGVFLAHDEFSRRLIVEGPGDKPRRLLDDAEMVRLYLAIDSQYHFRPGKDFFWMVLEDEARGHGFHPVRDYLNDLVWDGVKRLDGWLVVYGGAQEGEYTRAVGTIMMVASVRRVRQPGCKFDEIIVLESSQGLDKSTALRVLARQEDWFTDSLPLDGDDKQVIEAMTGKWLCEVAELRGMKKGEVEHLKAFLSRQVDRARMAYDRMVSEVARQCTFWATTNATTYLRDSTGNRRFWGVAVKRFDLQALRADADQLWAEAAAVESAGASIRLDPALYDAAADAQEERLIEDPWAHVIEQALDGYTTGRILSADLWNLLNIPTGQRTQEHNGRLGEAMRSLGWDRVKLRFNNKPVWHYAKGTAEERMILIRCERDMNGGANIYTESEDDRSRHKANAEQWSNFNGM